MKLQVSEQYTTAKAQRMADHSNRGTEEALHSPAKGAVWTAPGTGWHGSPPRFGPDAGVRLSFDDFKDESLVLHVLDCNTRLAEGCRKVYEGCQPGSLRFSSWRYASYIRFLELSGVCRAVAASLLANTPYGSLRRPAFYPETEGSYS